MNRRLMGEIVKHVFANLDMVYSPFVNVERTKSIISKDFLLSDKLSFQDEQGKTTYNRVWGCQISVAESEIKILAGDCSQDPQIPEYCLIVKLKDAPAYGLYLAYSDHLPEDQQVDDEVMLAVSVNDQDWMECSTYLQATFLAGMEQIKDIGLSWSKCKDYQTQFELMKSFLNFHSVVQEDADAWKKG